MRAAWYEKTGPARDVLQLGELEIPVVEPGQVLVRLHTSGINPSDVKRRSGWLKLGDDFPRIIPQNDGAGIIESVGKGVNQDRIGQRVWVHSPMKEVAHGTAAQYITLAESQVRHLPDSISYAEGACLGVPLFTAYNAVFRDGPVENQIILVAGGAGSVGHYALQLAKLAGATVITTVSSEDKADITKKAGADHIVNYQQQDVVECVMELTGGSGVDRIIEVDFGANISIDAKIIKSGGVIASYSSTKIPEPVFPYYPFALKGVTLRLVQAFILPTDIKRRFFEEISQRLENGELQHLIGARFPLEEIATAHEAMEQGKVIGKIIVEIP